MTEKWYEGGFRPLLCTYRLNWARRTNWGWWNEWDDTSLQTQDSKFEPWPSQAEHAFSRSWRLLTILNHYEWAGKKHFVSLKVGRPEWGSIQRSPTFQAGSFNHWTRAPAQIVNQNVRQSLSIAYLEDEELFVLGLQSIWGLTLSAHGP